MNRFVADDCVKSGIDEHVFAPADAHVGHQVVVEAEPRDRAGNSCGSCVSLCLRWPVQYQPERQEARDRLCSMPPRTVLNPADGELRILSYNVLADAYRSAWNVLFPYMREEHKEPDYRLQLAFDDIRALGVDIAGLQEVDSAFYEKFWKPQAALAGLESIFTSKTGGAAEGCALLVRNETLEVLECESINLAEAVSNSTSEEVLAFLRENPGIREAAEAVTTIAQLVLARHCSGQSCLLANTHSYFHPEAGSLRILQMNELIRKARSKANGHDPTGHIPIILMGDLNAELGDGSIELLRKGRIEADMWEWARSSFFSWYGSGGREYSSKLVVEPFETALNDAYTKAVPDAGNTGHDVSTERVDNTNNGNDGDAIARQARSNLLRRFRMCFNTATSGAACTRVGEPKDPSALSEEQAHAEAQKHAKAQCSFKTCPVLAQYILRRDAGDGLRVGVLSESELSAYKHLQDSLAKVCEQDINAVAAEQAVRVRDAPEMQRGKTEQTIGCGMHIELGMQFEPISGADHPFTNKVGGFSASLDHIMVNKGGACRIRSIEPLDSAVVENSPEGALPNATFPSDHIPLSADVKVGSNDE